MGKCVCCGTDDARIARRFVVVETIAARGDAASEREELIRGIIDGAICGDCFSAELEKLAKAEAKKFTLLFFRQRKRIAALRSGALSERISRFAGQIITQRLTRSGQYGGKCLIELVSGMSSVKPNALVQQYGILKKTEDDIKTLALSR